MPQGHSQLQTLQRGCVTTIPYLVGFLVLGCASIKTERFALQVHSNECQVTEARPSWLSTLTTVVCWDQNREPLGMFSTRGKAVIDVSLDFLEAVSLPLGYGLLGSAIRGAVDSLDGTQFKLDVSDVKHTIDVDGQSLNLPEQGELDRLINRFRRESE